MTIKKIATAALMASVALSPISPLSVPARADGKDVVAGIIFGAIINEALKGESKKKTTKSKKKKTKSSKPSISAEQRESNRETQTALNYFGYNLGTPDGSIGPKSRSAISNYQAFLGYPATGQLSDHERTILMTSYHRAVAGGPIVASTVSGSPLGLKAVLLAQRDEMAGVPSKTVADPAGPLPADGTLTSNGVPAPGSVAAAAVGALPTVLAPEREVEAAEVATVPEPAVEVVTETAKATLPSFVSPAGVKGLLSVACSDIELASTANGGMSTAETMHDPSFALGEQFCLARSFAIARSDELTLEVVDFTPEEVAGQCTAFGPVLKDHVAALSLEPAADVLGAVEGFISSSGMSPAQLSGTAKVCLGIGYANDDLGVAIGSALLLAAMGERGYSEYLGHHLSQGFGASERPDLALGWYEMSLAAMKEGQTVVAPGVEGRDAVIKKASYMINGRALELDLEPEAEIQKAALPLFKVNPDADAATRTPETAPTP